MTSLPSKWSGKCKSCGTPWKKDDIVYISKPKNVWCSVQACAEEGNGPKKIDDYQHPSAVPNTNPVQFTEPAKVPNTPRADEPQADVNGLKSKIVGQDYNCPVCKTAITVGTVVYRDQTHWCSTQECAKNGKFAFDKKVEDTKQDAENFSGYLKAKLDDLENIHTHVWARSLKCAKDSLPKEDPRTQNIVAQVIYKEFFPTIIKRKLDR